MGERLAKEYSSRKSEKVKELFNLSKSTIIFL